MCNCNKITICTEFDPAQIAGIQVPIASIHAFATLTVPDGYLVCDGAAVSRTDYADLFAALGTVWGAGDGTTTFNIPDLRGEFIRGFDAGRGVDAGRVFASLQEDEFKSHSHTNIATGVNSVSGSFGYLAGNGEGATGVSGGAETRPRNVAVTYAIKAFYPVAASA
ncbi:hypothetical protein AUP42_04135 [Thalassospira lucentensis]|uniref:Phage tail collar domain-containing protein n=1 Tax=Thalassospira lucentensis TaxID=168935 RepID=A0A154L2G0_9PROT|nr:phage tail protein [Thalassospira lucentensis]KZB62154.1 hypothetical protein AUP42_04135 [Thalassospira lucentensis]